MKPSASAILFVCAAFAVSCESPREPDETRLQSLGERFLTDRKQMSVPLPTPSDALFGASVDATDEHVVVGAPEQGIGGTVWVYTLSSTGITLSASLQPSVPRQGARFGAQVAVWGDTVAVTAPAQAGGTGSLHIFERAGTWTEVAVHQHDSDNYGASLDLESDTIVVGAPTTPTGGTGTGAVATYHRDVPNVGDWGAGDVIVADPGLSAFGAAVALQDDDLYVGAPGPATSPELGRVNFYVSSGAGTWNFENEIFYPVAAVGSPRFGASLAVTANYLFVGAPTNVSGDSTGAVFQFDRATRTHVGTIVSGFGVDSHFGAEVAARGPYLAVTAPLADEWAQDGGALRVYSVDPDLEIITTPDIAEELTGAADIGGSPAFNSTTLFAAHASEDADGPDSGIVVGLNRDANDDTVIDFDETMRIRNPAANAGGLGRAVSLEGGRIVAGAPFQVGSSGRDGVAWLFEQDAVEWTPQTELIGAGLDDAHFGAAVAQTADAIFVGAPGADSGQVFRFDEAASWDRVESLQSPNPTPGEMFGSSISTDGVTLAIGERVGGEVHLWEFANGWQPGPTLEGGLSVDVFGHFLVTGYGGSTPHEARLYHRENDSWALRATFEPPDDAVGLADEVEVGVDTAFVQAAGASPTEARGVVYVFHQIGAVDEWEYRRALRSPSDAPGAHFGGSVELAGDIVAIGAHGETIDGQSAAGAVYLHGRHVGGPQNWGLIRRIVLEPPEAQAQFGRGIAWDGERLAVGAPGQSGDSAGSGVIHVFSSPEMNGPPLAQDDEVVRDAEMADVPIDPLANDSDPDGDGLYVVLDGPPARGDVAFAADGTLVYTPGPDFTGSDSFTYRASDVFSESDPATVVIRSNRGTCGGGQCPEGEVCFAESCFAQCDANDQCGNQESCYEDRCALSACEGLECADGQVCYGGACFASCEEEACASGQCFEGRCAEEACQDVTCPIGSVCVGGGCFASCSTDDDCEPGDSCIEGRCASSACEGIQCTDGQACAGGSCFDSCASSDDCAANEICDESVCQPDVPPEECQSEDCANGGGCCATITRGHEALPAWLAGLFLLIGWRRR